MLAVVGMVMTCLAEMASASVVFKATDLTGGDWQYEYIITNEYSENLVHFDAAFPTSTDFVLYDAPSKVGWTIENVFGAYTYIAAADVGGGIAPGATEGGFVVSFTYSGLPGGVPAPQAYNVAYADSTTGSGITTEAVPEPGTWLLLTLSLPLVAGCRQLLKRNAA